MTSDNSSPLPQVVIAKRKARPFFARHPWVFAGSIDRVIGSLEPGAEVVVQSSEGQFIGRGLYNPHSAIRVRLFRWEDEALDDAFWKQRIESAVKLRTETLGLTGDRLAYRLIFSESDGLSGLVVDRYDKWLVAQVTSLAIRTRMDSIISILSQVDGVEGIVVRTERSTEAKEGLPHIDETAWGTIPEHDIVAVENGIEYELSLQAGQKTGFYCDQRENRLAAAKYAQGTDVLDLFCFTGSFGLNALKHGNARSILGIDASDAAIEGARRNAARNDFTPVEYRTDDVFNALDGLRAEGRKFGKVICDPPKFTQRAGTVPEALKGYLRLNRAAVDVVEPGGVLVTCSCSGLIDRAMFAETLSQVAELSRREIQILEIRSQAADHPISASCTETGYLKCFVCRIC